MTADRQDSIIFVDNAALQEDRLVRNSRRLRTLLQAVLGLLCVLAWAAFAEASLHEYRQTSSAVAQRDGNMAAAIEHYVVRVLRTARAVNNMMGGVLASGTRTEADVTELLADRLRANDIFQELGVCLADGRVLPTTTPGSALTRENCAYFAVQTARGPDVSVLAPIPQADRLLVPLTYALVDNAGRYLGVCVALVPVEKLLGNMNATFLADDTIVAVMGDDGRPRAAWRSHGMHIDDPLRLATLATGVSGHAHGQVATFDGADYLTSWRELPQDQLRIFVATNRADAFAAFQDRRTRFFVLCILLTGALVAAYVVLVKLGKQSLLRARALSRARNELEVLNEDLDEQVRVRTRQLEQACKDLESFSYTVAHDVRTPLACIAGFAEALDPAVAQSGNDKHLHYLRRIQASAAHMDALTRRLLDLSKATRAVPPFHEVDLSGIAEEVVCGLHHAEPGRKVDVTIEPGLRVHGDRTLLRQMLENLIGNAWKFSARQDRAAIALERQDHAGMSSFVVRDNGVGFDSDTSPELFQPFRRLHDESVFQGTGLGLATVQRIVTLHGGAVWCQSKVGEGARFFFTLPQAGAAAA